MALLGLAALACGARVTAAAITVSVLQRDGRPLVGAVLTIEAESPGPRSAAPLQATMDQVDLAFVPDVLVIPVGSSVLFPNSDAVSHQVYSFSSARRFQLPLYRRKPYPPVLFDQAGIVTLGCNIHDNMLGYIVVTDAPWFGRSGPGGDWAADQLPAGRYRVRAWHPLLNDTDAVEQLVELGADDARLELRLKQNLRYAPLTGRPHSWQY